MEARVRLLLRADMQHVPQRCMTSWHDPLTEVPRHSLKEKLSRVTSGAYHTPGSLRDSALCFCRWTGNNGPEQTDYIAMRNLIEATPKSVKRFVLTTSAGVDRSNKIPFSILNLFGKHTTALPDCIFRHGLLLPGLPAACIQHD